ncbi:MAG TPA: Lpg1974 family pore-forming outer membrane protein [Pirellulaceae bacterium]
MARPVAQLPTTPMIRPTPPLFGAAPPPTYTAAAIWNPVSITSTIDPAEYLETAPPISEQPLALDGNSNATVTSAGNCCCDPLWCHRSGVFADLLYLRPGNIDYVYAVEQTGPLRTDSPTGPVGRVGFDGAMGYRVGATQALSDCSSLQVSYTWFQDDTQSSIAATAPNVLILQPALPNIANVGSTGIVDSARYDIRFQQVDIDYRGLLYGTYDSAVNYFAGVRYANLKQDFRAQEDTGVPVGLSAVNTNISFDGFGIGFGIDGMKRSAYSGLMVYGRSSASFVAGEFKANYVETTQLVVGPVGGNNLVDYRVMTILQTELGTGWQSRCGRVRITAGYQFAGWFNALTTGSYIQGVQNRQFNNLNETITFDGLVTRFLWQF